MVSISVKDYVGKIKDGVAILLSLDIDGTIYQMIFWINKDRKYVLNADQELLNILGVKKIYDYENLEEILTQIFKVLPPINDIFKQFEV